MSLYIQKENVKMIWEVMMICPLFNAVFATEFSKKEWFNKIIMNIHKKIKQDIKVDELVVINRDTIKVMMANLKELNLRMTTDIKSRIEPLAFGSNNDLAFTQRQNEYDMMKNTYVPPQIDFRSNEIDNPIKNMDELIENHINERNKTLLSSQSEDLNVGIVSQEISRGLSLINPTAPYEDTIKKPKKVRWHSRLENQESELEYKVDNMMIKLDALMISVDKILSRDNPPPYL